jgi:hypothetical protein
MGDLCVLELAEVKALKACYQAQAAQKQLLPQTKRWTIRYMHSAMYSMISIRVLFHWEFSSSKQPITKHLNHWGMQNLKPFYVLDMIDFSNSSCFSMSRKFLPQLSMVGLGHESSEWPSEQTL